jgi:BolA family transcriptional regulator, general stress-responsive regulator
MLIISAGSKAMQPIQHLIERKLTETFQPDFLQVENESHAHSVPAGSESHFKLVLVSRQFVGKRPVQRQQAVYAALAEALAAGVHALAMHTYTPEEWSSAKVPVSPACMGGSLRDKT